MIDASVIHVCPTCGKKFYAERGVDYAFKLKDSESKHGVLFCSWRCLRAAKTDSRGRSAKSGYRGKCNPWRIKYFQGDRLVAIGTATELSELTGKPSGTIRIYALRRKRFKTGMFFEYEDAYYERKNECAEQASRAETWDGVSDRDLHEMARESASRGLSYGALQAEEYFTRHPSGIKIPEGYTSMKDREGNQ